MKTKTSTKIIIASLSFFSLPTQAMLTPLVRAAARTSRPLTTSALPRANTLSSLVALRSVQPRINVTPKPLALTLNRFQSNDSGSNRNDQNNSESNRFHTALGTHHIHSQPQPKLESNIGILLVGAGILGGGYYYLRKNYEKELEIFFADVTRKAPLKEALNQGQYKEKFIQLLQNNQVQEVIQLLNSHDCAREVFEHRFWYGHEDKYSLIKYAQSIEMLLALLEQGIKPTYQLAENIVANNLPYQMLEIIMVFNPFITQDDLFSLAVEHSNCEIAKKVYDKVPQENKTNAFLSCRTQSMFNCLLELQITPPTKLILQAFEANKINIRIAEFAYNAGIYTEEEINYLREHEKELLTKLSQCRLEESAPLEKITFLLRIGLKDTDGSAYKSALLAGRSEAAKLLWTPERLNDLRRKPLTPNQAIAQAQSKPVRTQAECKQAQEKLATCQGDDCAKWNFPECKAILCPDCK